MSIVLWVQCYGYSVMGTVHITLSCALPNDNYVVWALFVCTAAFVVFYDLTCKQLKFKLCNADSTCALNRLSIIAMVAPFMGTVVYTDRELHYQKRYSVMGTVLWVSSPWLHLFPFICTAPVWFEVCLLCVSRVLLYEQLAICLTL